MERFLLLASGTGLLPRRAGEAGRVVTTLVVLGGHGAASAYVDTPGTTSAARSNRHFED